MKERLSALLVQYQERLQPCLGEIRVQFLQVCRKAITEQGPVLYDEARLDGQSCLDLVVG